MVINHLEGYAVINLVAFTTIFVRLNILSTQNEHFYKDQTPHLVV